MHSRRQFLGCISVLSAGAAFAGLPDLYAGVQPQGLDLKALWIRFCTVFDGKALGKSLERQLDVLPVPGHFYQTGAAVSFAAADIVAQPVWIYWGQQRQSPADLTVVLYAANDLSGKLKQLNRFELEALMQLEGKMDQLLKQISLRTASESSSPVLQIKPKVDGGAAVHTTIKQLKSQIAFQTKNFVYC